MNIKQWFYLPDLIRRLILSWLTAVTIVYAMVPQNLKNIAATDCFTALSLPVVLMLAADVFIIIFVLSCVFSYQTAKGERFAIAGVFLLLSILTLTASFSISYLLACVLILAILCIYAIYGWQDEETAIKRPKPGSRPAAAAVIVIALMFFIFVSIWTVCRIWTFSAPAYDFGIFSQMFHHMRTTGLPNTTVERDGLLSHFSVHVSPIYYLMLPFYCIFPFPETLQILQAAVLASAVIPAWKLTRRHGCLPFAAALFCLILLLYPAYAGGAGYDLHENAFLTPLLLWLFYGIDCQNIPLISVFGILTLTVKEDAAVYVAVAGLWLLLRALLRRSKRTRFDTCAGICLLIGAVLWFGAVTAWLSVYGTGVMTYRYSNFIYDGSSSLFSVIKAVIMLPIKVLYECSEPEKLKFIAQTLLPFAALPLFTGKYERYILLIPYILVNLMSDYTYQHDIFFQYTYGSTAFLFYLAVINYEDIAVHVRRLLMKYTPLLLSAAIAALCFVIFIVPTASRYPKRYIQNKAYYASIDQLLDTIPKDASVSAAAFYVVPLSDRDVLYTIRYASVEHILSSDYVVLDLTGSSSYKNFETENASGYDNLVQLLLQNGYTMIAQAENAVAVYQKTNGHTMLAPSSAS